jgi:acyl-homoserine-lactone acylase
MQIKKTLSLISAGVLALLLSGCHLLDYLYEDSIDAEVGTLTLKGLKQPVEIRRDEFGIPAIKASNTEDLTFATGYAMASDRLAQMYSMTLLAQGRLSEMAGPVALDMDKYMRTLGINQIVQKKYAATDDSVKALLESFSRGVNAYIETHQSKLPLDFDLSNYKPEPWQPENSIYLLSILNLGVAFNSHEEVAYLNLAKQLGHEKAAWLVPSYPDEPLPFDEAKKLDGIDLNVIQDELLNVAYIQNDIMETTSALGIAASNNWAVHKSKTKNNASIIANDTHLLLSQPAVWMMMSVDSPDYHASGISLAGVPSVVAGYNGYIAWGETMVMADSQDIFLEQLKDINGKKHYLFKGEWLPTKERIETFNVRGGNTETLTVHETHHGPILNSVIKKDPAHVMMMIKSEQQYGLALSWTATQPDKTIEGFLNMARAKNMDEAKAALSDVGYIHLNVIYGDKDNIAWQVTGNYPQRKKGTGFLPSPGWTGEYDWGDYVGVEKFPYILNPQQGFIGTGNDRTVDTSQYDFTLSNSWYFPERGERIKQMLSATDQHTAQTSIDMQADQHDLSVLKIQQVFKRLETPLAAAIDSLSKDDQAKARSTLKTLLKFNGDMLVNSQAGAVMAMFDHQLTRGIFYDELGADDILWKSFINMNGRSYSAYQDHLLGRENSPFWDDVTTKIKEDKPLIIAKALANTQTYGKKLLDVDSSQWQLGQLQNYTWESAGTQMKSLLPFYEQWGVFALSSYLDRGPYPAGGSRNTLNVAGYDVGNDYDVWNVPAMRLVVDFSLDEPMYLTNAGGQSGNPASPYYDKGIETWLKAENRNIPFKRENIKTHFSKLLMLSPE